MKIAGSRSTKRKDYTEHRLFYWGAEDTPTKPQTIKLLKEHYAEMLQELEGGAKVLKKGGHSVSRPGGHVDIIAEPSSAEASEARSK